jgi:hypothetical protein
LRLFSRVESSACFCFGGFPVEQPICRDDSQYLQVHSKLDDVHPTSFAWFVRHRALFEEIATTKNSPFSPSSSAGCWLSFIAVSFFLFSSFLLQRIKKPHDLKMFRSQRKLEVVVVIRSSSTYAMLRSVWAGRCLCSMKKIGQSRNEAVQESQTWITHVYVRVPYH